MKLKQSSKDKSDWAKAYKNMMDSYIYCSVTIMASMEVQVYNLHQLTMLWEAFILIHGEKIR